MESNKFKNRISRMIRGSLMGSCSTRNVLDKSVYVPQSQRHLLHPPSFSSSSSTFSCPNSKTRRLSTCKPRCPETFHVAVNNCIVPRQKLSDHRHPYHPLDRAIITCPPVSPLSPLKELPGPTHYQPKRNTVSAKKKKKNRTTASATTKKRSPADNNHYLKKSSSLFSSSSQDSAYFGDSHYYWSSSEEEHEYSDTLFSSSDSSASRHRHSRRRTSRQKKRSSRRRRPSTTDSGNKSCEKKVLMPMNEEVAVKDSFAVVKSSSDPYNDFRTSMVEMIIEKQIFGAKELEQLLHCFLSLNSINHHAIIIEVFTEICQTLFS